MQLKVDGAPFLICLCLCLSFVFQIPLLTGTIMLIVFIEWKGRRLMHLGGLVFGFFGALLIFASELVRDYGGDDVNTFVVGVFAILGAALVYFGFGFGPCMIPFFIFGEITPLAARSTTASFCVAANWCVSVLYTALYYPLLDIMGAWVQLFMCIPTLFIFIYLYKKMPESRGMSVDDVVCQWLDGEETYLLNQEGEENISLAESKKSEKIEESASG